jgi:5'-3' exonuclease
MGIPTFYRQIVSDFPSTKIWTPNIPISRLYIDFNSMIYNAISIMSNRTSKESKSSFEFRLIGVVLDQLYKLIITVGASKEIYIAMDGTPPLAKMIQQRARRYKSLKEEHFKTSIEKKYKIKFPSNDWDRNAISPGTEFMQKLSDRIHGSIKTQLNGTLIRFSDYTEPGEGEHKILREIGKIGKGETIKETSGGMVIYSPDADLIILSIVAGLPDMYIIRNEENGGKFIADSYEYLDINVCKDIFSKQMNNQSLVDYSFMSFLCGNDFVMASPFLNMKEGGMKLLIDLYSETGSDQEMPKPHEPLIVSGRINIPGLLELINSLSKIENDKLRQLQRKRDRVRYGPRGAFKIKNEEGKEIWDIEMIRFNHEEYYSPCHPQFEHLNRVFDKIDYYSKEWINQYNLHFFRSTNPVVIKKVCEEYLKSLAFCFDYYYKGVPTWDWCYNYNAAPTMTQFAEYLMTMRNMDQGTDLVVDWGVSSPMRPFEQLLCILPRQSLGLLPPIVKANAPIDMYPQKIILNIVHGTKFIYSDPILPEIPVERIKKIIKDNEHKFNKYEKQRNKLANYPI